VNAAGSLTPESNGNRYTELIIHSLFNSGRSGILHRLRGVEQY
jgi:hypothetical protein